MVCNLLSHGTILTIIHDHLEKKKVSSRWVLKILIDNHIVNHLAAMAQFLILNNAEHEDLFDRIVTGDEKCVYHFNSPPPNKSGFEAVVDKGGQAPKKVKIERSAKIVYLTWFWNCEGIFLEEYDPKV